MDRQKRGFTLLELMVVVIIIGILASLAIPRFIVARDKAIEAEAKNMLGALRGSQVRYALENNNEYAEEIDDLDVEPGTSRYYTYVGADDATSPTYVAGATVTPDNNQAPDHQAIWIEANGNIRTGSGLPGGGP